MSKVKNDAQTLCDLAERVRSSEDARDAFLIQLDKTLDHGSSIAHERCDKQVLTCLVSAYHDFKTEGKHGMYVFTNDCEKMTVGLVDVISYLKDPSESYKRVIMDAIHIVVETWSEFAARFLTMYKSKASTLDLYNAADKFFHRFHKETDRMYIKSGSFLQTLKNETVGYSRKDMLAAFDLEVCTAASRLLPTIHYELKMQLADLDDLHQFLKHTFKSLENSKSFFAREHLRKPDMLSMRDDVFKS